MRTAGSNEWSIRDSKGQKVERIYRDVKKKAFDRCEKEQERVHISGAVTGFKEHLWQLSCIRNRSPGPNHSVRHGWSLGQVLRFDREARVHCSWRLSWSIQIQLRRRVVTLTVEWRAVDTKEVHSEFNKLECQATARPRSFAISARPHFWL